VKLHRVIVCLSLSTFLNGCGSYPRLLNFPFNPNGRSFNSRASELNPQVAAEYIAFISDRNNSQDVYLFDAKNRRLINLPGLNSLDEIASSASVSENGRYVVFAATRQGKSGIYLYDRTTQQKRLLTGNVQNEVRNPMINADGTKIVFEIANNGQWDIGIIDIRGKPLNLPGNIIK
jgi:Tol biopolymer transport system component